MKIFHYTSLEAWSGIEAFPEKGLRPSEYRGMRHPQTGVIEQCVFAFQDAAPYEWICNPDFRGEFNWLVTAKTCAIDPARQLTLIEADVPEEDVWISDYAQYYHRDQPPYTKDEAVETYFSSLVPAGEYQRGAHEMPEAIYFGNIPKSQLRVAKIFTPTDEKLNGYFEEWAAAANTAYLASDRLMAPPCVTVDLEALVWTK